jgi:hypothetical protein
MIPVMAYFVLDKKHNEDRTGHSDNQARDVNDRKCFMPLDVSQSDFQIIVNHNNVPVEFIPKKAGQGFGDLFPIPEIGFKRT